MSDVATARANFLSRLDDYCLGDSARLAPALDEVIRWSEDNDLQHRPPAGVQALVRYAMGGRIFWSAVAMKEAGARFTLLGDPRFPEPLREEARVALARIEGTVGRNTNAERDAPGLPLAKLIWEPYRQAVLELMARLLEGLKVPA